MAPDLSLKLYVNNSLFAVIGKLIEDLCKTRATYNYGKYISYTPFPPKVVCISRFFNTISN